MSEKNLKKKIKKYFFLFLFNLKDNCFSSTDSNSVLCEYGECHNVTERRERNWKYSVGTSEAV